MSERHDQGDLHHNRESEIGLGPGRAAQPLVEELPEQHDGRRRGPRRLPSPARPRTFRLALRLALPPLIFAAAWAARDDRVAGWLAPDVFGIRLETRLTASPVTWRRCWPS